MMVYLIPVLVALTLITAAVGIYQMNVRGRRVSARLQRVVEVGEVPVASDDLADLSIPVLLRPIAFLAWILPTQIYSEALKWQLAQAGYRHLDAPKVFTGFRVLTTAVLGLAGLLVTWQFRMSQTEILVVTLLSCFLGFYLPVMVLRVKQNRRKMEILLALPDALDLLVICVEAGQGLNAALLKVGKECEFKSSALSKELTTINAEMRAGITRTQALRNFALRTDVDDVRAFVAVMIQSDRFGTSIAQALRVHSDSLRTRRRQRAEENARKAPVKLVFPLVFCIFPELLVVILAPGMLSLFRALAKMAQGN
jgi:tight adherence protein C